MSGAELAPSRALSLAMDYSDLLLRQSRGGEGGGNGNRPRT